jgi:4,5-dihydroxyphthalate decarboxylase
MSNPLQLTLAVAHYDRHIPLLDGSVQPEGIHLTVLEVGQAVRGKHGAGRHGRMLKHGEFDFAEVSLSSYLVARDRGRPVLAIPVFPRRLFSMSNMYVYLPAGIRSPHDLVGRRVGLNSYQTSLSVLAKGDLAHEYGVPWKQISWVTAREETIPFEAPAEVRLERSPPGGDLGRLLAEGELAALFVPHPPRVVLERDPRVGPLFPDAQAEETRYFQKNGYYPIMHVVCVRADVLEGDPWTARAIFEAFEQARAASLCYYEDPNWSRFAWGRHYVEEERRLLGMDPWRNGLVANRVNLDRFIRYEHEQGLISHDLAVDALFAESTLDT